MNFKRRIFYLTILFICIFISLQKTFGQIGKSSENKQDEVIRVDSNLVTVPTTVLDRDGRYITNLKKDDFQIFEDGVEQEIALFETTEQPFTIFLLLDRSGSMSRDLAELARATNSFVNQLRPDDQIIAADFATFTYVLTETTKVKDMKKGIKIKPNGEIYTMLYDAVDFALKKMQKIRGRKAIVIFSDGMGSGYNASAKSTLRDAQEGESLVYTVQFKTYEEVAPPYVNKKLYYEKIEIANKYMRDLPQVTGGRDYQIENITDLEKTFSTVANELRRQYALGYYRKQATKGKKQIKVKVRQSNLVVRARDSYIVK